MSTKMRVIICLLAGLIVLAFQALLGMRPNGIPIATAITFTALITMKFRKEKDE